MSEFIQAFSGADFLTPHNHQDKPKCKFCHADGINWTYLLFECDKYDSKIRKRLQNLDLSSQTKNYWNQCIAVPEYGELTDLLFGCNPNHHFKNDVSTLTILMATTISKIHRDWAAAGEDAADD